MDVDEVAGTGSRPDRLAGVRPQERVQQHPVDQIVDTAHALPILDVPVPLMGEQLVDVLRGGRPAPLPEVAGWQERIQRHTGEQMIDDLPYVQILDAPVPQVVDSAMDFFRRLDLPVAEQVIDVPMISSSSCSSRAVLREAQMAEQLVDVPIQHIVELLLQHPVDIPVLQVGVSGGGQQGFLSGQGSVGEQIVDIPASGRGVSGSLLGFHPEQCSTAPYFRVERISERIVEQTVAVGDFSSRAPRRGGPRGGLPPVQGSAVDFSVPLGDADEGVFRTFLGVKKCAKVGAHSRSELAAHSSSSTPGADGVVSSLEEPVQEEKEEHQVSPMPDSIEWVQLSDDKGRTYYWNRRTRVTRWKPLPGIRVVWVGEKDSGGEVWYWHNGTRVSTYDLPPLPPE